MATRTILVLAVVLASFLEIQVLAQSITTPLINSTVATIAPTTAVASSASISPTSASTVVPSTSVNGTRAPPMNMTTRLPTPSPTSPASSKNSSDIEISLVATLKGEECKQTTGADIEKWIKHTVFNGNSIVKHSEVKTYASGNDCKANITITFGKGQVDITTLVNGSKMMLNGTKVTFGSQIYGKVDGVALEIKFELDPKDCKDKCCDGGGGPIDATMSCKPKDKCGALKLVTTTFPDCSIVCPKCGGNGLQASLMVLIFAGLLNWLMKQ